MTAGALRLPGQPRSARSEARVERRPGRKPGFPPKPPGETDRERRLLAALLECERDGVRPFHGELLRRAKLFAGSAISETKQKLEAGGFIVIGEERGAVKLTDKGRKEAQMQMVDDVIIAHLEKELAR